MEKFIRYWLRSGSFRLAYDHNTTSTQLHSIKWNNRFLHYRPGTSDVELIYKILFRRKKEYTIPKDLTPKTLLDIGANIGVSTVFFANLFPECQIFAFEPIKENFELLSKNVRDYPNVRVLPYALGTHNEIKEIFFSDNPVNFGGYSFFESGSNTSLTTKVEIRETENALNSLGISNIDLIKIDTEGSEYNILKSLSPTRLQSVQWITGELHGVKDFELLNYLSEWFDLGAQKTVGSRMSHFQARQKSNLSH